MKSLIVAFLIIIPFQIYALTQQSVFALAEESVRDTLGFDEDTVKIEWMESVVTSETELTVKTTAVMYISPEIRPANFNCVTLLHKTNNTYSALNTKCEMKR